MHGQNGSASVTGRSGAALLCNSSLLPTFRSCPASQIRQQSDVKHLFGKAAAAPFRRPPSSGHPAAAMPVQQRQLFSAAMQLLQRQSAHVPASARLYVAAEQAVVNSGISPAATASVHQRAAELLRNWKQLSKFRLSALVVASSAAGFVAGSDERVDWSKLAWTALGTMGAAASANTLNQLYEVQRDALMMRTRNRPLPQGRVTPRHALTFALVTGIGGVSILYWKANGTTAALGAANIGLYAGVYTPLKAVSMANTWVGAVVGAIPPLMGWAAASGSLDAGAAALAAALYFWQLPHFLSLAWLCRGDYARGGYRMLSLVDATGRRTAACCLRNSLYLMPAGLLAYQLGVASSWFATEAGIMAGIMAITAARFYRNPSNSSAKGLFRASLLYLPVFMTGLMIHRTPERRLGASAMAAEASGQSGANSAAADEEHAADSTERSRGEGRPGFAPPFPLLPLPNRS